MIASLLSGLSPRDRMLAIQGILAFLFGIIFVIVLLGVAIFVPEPKPFPLLVFRVVLALCAAGVGAIIPGFISVNVHNYVRAGGAIACFVIVYWFNPPALVVSENREYLDKLRLAESSLAAGNYHHSKELFVDAARLEPNAWQPSFGIGQAEYLIGNYSTAYDWYNKAWKLAKTPEPKIRYSMALAAEGSRQFSQSIEIFQELKSNLSPGSLYTDVIFSLGQVFLLRFFDKSEINDLKDSKLNFVAFLESGGIPQHWASYHLACIHAVEADNSPTEERNDKIKEAHRHLIAAVEGLRKYSGLKSDIQKQIFADLMKPVSTRNVRPGDPVRCKNLPSKARELWPEIASAFAS